MSNDLEEAARAALRARQGKGARYDAPNAPARELAWARRGTAYFARKLNELSDEDLYGASLIPGWTRAHVVAHVGYNARALSRLVEWARTGEEHAMYPSPEARDDEIELGATLPARALRNLFRHSMIHLDVEWRDLSAQDWDAEVRDMDGGPIPVRGTTWLRAREVWTRAVDLANGGSFHDVPPELLDALIANVVAERARGGEGMRLVLRPTDRGDPILIGGEGGQTISGRAADLARWLTGRGARGLDCSDGAPPALLSWPATGTTG